jgi:hypothetical protein
MSANPAPPPSLLYGITKLFGQAGLALVAERMLMNFLPTGGADGPAHLFYAHRFIFSRFRSWLRPPESSSLDVSMSSASDIFLMMLISTCVPKRQSTFLNTVIICIAPLTTPFLFRNHGCNPAGRPEVVWDAVYHQRFPPFLRHVLL